MAADVWETSAPDHPSPFRGGSIVAGAHPGGGLAHLAGAFAHALGALAQPLGRLEQLLVGHGLAALAGAGDLPLAIVAVLEPLRALLHLAGAILHALGAAEHAVGAVRQGGGDRARRFGAGAARLAHRHLDLLAGD